MDSRIPTPITHVALVRRSDVRDVTESGAFKSGYILALRCNGETFDVCIICTCILVCLDISVNPKVGSMIQSDAMLKFDRSWTHLLFLGSWILDPIGSIISGNHGLFAYIRLKLIQSRGISG